MAYTQAEVDSALSNLLASDPNASRADVLAAAAAYGISPDQVNTAYSVYNAPAPVVSTPPPPAPAPVYEEPAPASIDQIIQDAYASIGRTGFGGETSQIDQSGFDYWKSEIESGRIAPDDFRNVFDTAVQNYVSTAAPDDPYVAQINALNQAAPVYEEPVYSAPTVTAAPLSTTIATESDAIGEYNRLLNAGYSDAQIRDAADQIYGTQTDADWAYLQSKASGTNVPAPVYEEPAPVYEEPSPLSPPAYTQAEVNSALSNLLASDPNASYQNVITAAGNYGITPEQVNAAYSANLPGMTREQGLAALNQTMNQPLSWTPFDMPGNDGLTSGDILGYTSTGQGVRNVYGDPYWYAEGDNAEYRRDPIGYSASLTNPMKLGTGEYGYYEGIYDPQGNLQDIQWQKAEEHKGWFGENLDWIAPLLITGGAYGLNALAGAAGAGAGAASAVAGVEGVASQAALTAYESAIAAGATQAAALAAADSAAAQAATALNLGADTVSFDPGGLNTGADTLTSATVDVATTGTTDLAANAVGGVEGQASQFATSAYQDAIAAGLTEQQALLAADTASALAGSGLSYADALSSALETASTAQSTGWVTGAENIAGGGGELVTGAGAGATGITSLLDRLIEKVGSTAAGKLITGLANGTVSELGIETILKGGSQILGAGSVVGALLDTGEGENKTLPVNDQGLANLITPYTYTRAVNQQPTVTSQSALDYLMGKAPAAGAPATTSARDWFRGGYTQLPSFNPVTGTTAETPLKQGKPTYTVGDTSGALRELLRVDPNASYKDILAAAATYGLTQADVNEAYAALNRTPYTQNQVNEALSALRSADPNSTFADIQAVAASYGVTPEQLSTAVNAYNDSFAQDLADAYLEAAATGVSGEEFIQTARAAGYTDAELQAAYDKLTSKAANGGLMALNMAMGGGVGHLGGYSDGGRLLRGPGDGVSDSIPATIGNKQPAQLADGEFVIPARIVSELGNGSTEAGARQLYAMMDRIQKSRRKSIGKGKVAVDAQARKHLPA